MQLDEELASHTRAGELYESLAGDRVPLLRLRALLSDPSGFAGRLQSPIQSRR